MATRQTLKSSVYWRNQKAQAVTNGDMYPTAEDLITLVEMSTQRSGSELQARNVGDTAYANFRADTITAETAFVGNLTGAASSVTATGRVQGAQGAAVVAANNLVLGTDGNTFEITGATQINLISNLSWQNGSTITLLFATNPLVKNATTTSTTNITILLDGAVDFQATAGDTLSLILSSIGGVQAWRETGRSVL